jgi:putative heme-binding domain-containing protein
MRILASMLLALSLAAQHVGKADEKKTHPAIGNPQAIAAGKGLFVTSCAGCHGPSGEGGRGPNLHDRGAWHPLDDEGMFLTIRNGIPGADMPPTKLPDDQLWQIVAFVKSLTAPAIETKPAGNPESGEALFWGKGECGNCHRIRGKGGVLGPDLSNVGAIRSIEKLREAILNPDADGFRGYRAVTATLKSGESIRGVARNYTNYSLQILDRDGRVRLLQTADLRDLSFGEHSPMPGDYRQRLSRPELADLLAFLSRQSVRPYEPPKRASDPGTSNK